MASEFCGFTTPHFDVEKINFNCAHKSYLSNILQFNFEFNLLPSDEANRAFDEEEKTIVSITTFAIGSNLS